MSVETTFSPHSAALGGVLIGLAVVSLMATLGRVAGISGILGVALRSLAGPRAGPSSRSGTSWTWAFLAGLVLGGALLNVLLGGLLGGWVHPREGFPVWALVLAGLLVGFGTSLGSGCTSGHGVCGLSRMSPRSLVATVVFMLVGVATATVLRAGLFS